MYAKKILLISLFLLFSTPVFAEGQNGMLSAFIIIGIFESIIIGLILGFLIKGMCYVFKKNISYKNALILSGTLAVVSFIFDTLLL